MSRTKEITEDLRKKKVIRLEKFTKPSLKSLDSTNPHSDRLCTNGGNSRPMLPSREGSCGQPTKITPRQNIQGCKSFQGNF